MNKKSLIIPAILCAAFLSGCATPVQEEPKAEAPEYFLLRPEVEKAYGYTHAVRVGDDIKISGAVSMDGEGNPTAVGDLEQQMKNAYSDLDQVLKHYGCTTWSRSE